MSSETIYHYVYRITNIILKRHYYGVRTSKNIIPQNDLGVKYFSSSRDKEFKIDQKQNPQNYKYKVIRIFQTREEAANFEIFLHNKFDVGKNPNFYNKAKQTATGFGTAGIPMSSEQKLFLSKLKIGNVPYNKGIPCSENQKEKISLKLSGVSMTEETKNKISNTLKNRPSEKKGKKLPQEHIDKIKNAKINKNTIYLFLHKEFGYYACTIKQLCHLFTNLNEQAFVRLRSKKRKFYKNWMIIFKE